MCPIPQKASTKQKESGYNSQYETIEVLAQKTVVSLVQACLHINLSLKPETRLHGLSSLKHASKAIDVKFLKCYIQDTGTEVPYT